MFVRHKNKSRQSDRRIKFANWTFGLLSKVVSEAKADCHSGPESVFLTCTRVRGLLSSPWRWVEVRRQKVSPYGSKAKSKSGD